MAGINAFETVGVRELLSHLDNGRMNVSHPHKYTATHPVLDGEMIDPGFDDKGKLAEYYAGLIDGIIFVENHPEELGLTKETK